MLSQTADAKPSSVVYWSIDSRNFADDDNYHPDQKTPTNFFVPYPLSSSQVPKEIQLMEVEIPNTFYNFRTFKTKQFITFNTESVTLNTKKYFTIQEFLSDLKIQYTNVVNTGSIDSQPLYGVFADGMVDIEKTGKNKLTFEYRHGYRLCSHDFRNHLTTMYGELFLGETLRPLIDDPLYTIPIDLYGSGIQSGDVLNNMGVTLGFEGGIINDVHSADDAVTILSALGTPTTGVYFVAANQIFADSLIIDATNNSLVAIIGDTVYKISIPQGTYDKSISPANVAWRDSSVFYIDPDEFYFPKLSEAIYFASKSLFPDGYFVNVLMRKYDIAQDATMPASVCDRFFVSFEHAQRPPFYIHAYYEAGKLLGVPDEYVPSNNSYIGPFRVDASINIPHAFTMLMVTGPYPDIKRLISTINTWYASGGDLPALVAHRTIKINVPAGMYTPTTLTSAINSELTLPVSAELEMDPVFSTNQVIRFYNRINNTDGKLTEWANALIMNYDINYDQLCSGIIPTIWDKQRILSTILNTGGKMMIDGATRVNEMPYTISATNLSPMSLNTSIFWLYIGESDTTGPYFTYQYMVSGYYNISDLVTELNRQTQTNTHYAFPGDPATQKQWEIYFSYSKKNFTITINCNYDTTGTPGTLNKNIRILSDVPITDYSQTLYQMLGFSKTQDFVDTIASGDLTVNSSNYCIGKYPVSIVDTEYCYILCNLVEGKDNTYVTTGDNISSILARLQIPANAGDYVMSTGGFPPIQITSAQDKISNIGVQFVLVDRYGAELQGVANWSLSLKITY